MSKYMWALLISVSLPLILSFYPPLKFYRNFKALLISILAVLFYFGTWDIFATCRGHWSFNKHSVGDITIINLPLEEVLFFIIITFCFIFTWEVVLFYKKKCSKNTRS